MHCTACACQCSVRVFTSPSTSSLAAALLPAARLARAASAAAARPYHSVIEPLACPVATTPLPAWQHAAVMRLSLRPAAPPHCSPVA
eukprot:9930-Heterococcus_DN1.PRE.1